MGHGRAVAVDVVAGDESWFVERAAHLHESLRDKLLTLPDELEIYPGHQAGSVCGAGLPGKPSSTIGFEKRFNPLLRIDSRGAFVQRVVSEIPPRPADMERIMAANSRAS